jgi:hypothetical protein
MERKLRIALKDKNQLVVHMPRNILINNALRSCGIPFADMDLRKTINNWNKDNDLDCKICIVVDDDLEVLFVTEQGLKQDGHFVLTYRKVKTAINHLSNWLTADIAIVDFNMPEQKGDILLNYMKLNTDIPRLILRTGNWDVNVPEGVELSRKPYALEL